MQSVTQSVNQLVSHSVHLLIMCPMRNKGGNDYGRLEANKVMRCTEENMENKNNEGASVRE